MNWNNLKSYQLGPEFVLNKKACFNCGDFSHLANDCRKRVQRETTRSQNHAYKSPSHRSGGHRPHGAPMRPPLRSDGHRPHGGSMRPSHRPVGHRPHGPSMNPMRPNMNGARPKKSFFIQAHSYKTRPFSSAVKTQYRAPWVPTVNRNNPLLIENFPLVEEIFPLSIGNFPLLAENLPLKVWTLVDCPKGVRPIGTKWVLKNKKDEKGIVVRNKAKLVAQGYTQEEGIDYDELFAPVARIKAIRLFLAYASFMGFTVYQMDVKSAFLYGTIDEEVYVMQPLGFQDPMFPVKVYKVAKRMYGLHQAPRAWYGTLSKYLLKNGFQRGTIDQTFFIRRQREDFILVQVYVDDIIFGSSNPQLCREFEALMHEKFQMSAMGESLGKGRDWKRCRTPSL
nr:putative ribonuclease H-like domain-containing protein [Tanacetum cinerariifolium]